MAGKSYGLNRHTRPIRAIPSPWQASNSNTDIQHDFLKGFHPGNRPPESPGAWDSAELAQAFLTPTAGEWG